MASLGFQEGNGNFIADVNRSRTRLMLSAFFTTLSLVYSFIVFPDIFVGVTQIKKEKIVLKKDKL